MDQIHQLIDHGAMLNDHPYRKKEIDPVMDILHTAMNTTNPTIRISGEDKPAMVIIDKLMKLDKGSIIYVDHLTYSAPEQFSLKYFSNTL